MGDWKNSNKILQPHLHFEIWSLRKKHKLLVGYRHWDSCSISGSCLSDVSVFPFVLHLRQMKIYETLITHQLQPVHWRAWSHFHWALQIPSLSNNWDSEQVSLVWPECFLCTWTSLLTNSLYTVWETAALCPSPIPRAYWAHSHNHGAKSLELGSLIFILSLSLSLPPSLQSIIDTIGL